jgi:hypothetical protein
MAEMKSGRKDPPGDRDDVNPVGNGPPVIPSGFGFPPDGTFHGQRIYHAEKVAEISEAEAEALRPIARVNPQRRDPPTDGRGRRGDPPIPERPPSQRRG